MVCWITRRCRQSSRLAGSIVMCACVLVAVGGERRVKDSWTPPLAEEAASTGARWTKRCHSERRGHRGILSASTVSLLLSFSEISLPCDEVVIVSVEGLAAPWRKQSASRRLLLLTTASSSSLRGGLGEQVTRLSTCQRGSSGQGQPRGRCAQSAQSAQWPSWPVQRGGERCPKQPPWCLALIVDDCCRV